MTGFVVAAGILLAALVPAGIACFRGGEVERLAGLEASSAIVALALVVLPIAIGRPIFLDLAVAAAFLSLGGGLVFARFLERWL